MQITLLAVVTALPAPIPKATLPEPVVLFESARLPMAVLEVPTLFETRAYAPLAVLLKPPMLLKSAPVPVAVFSSPVLARSVPAPTAVLKLPAVSLRSDKKPDRRVVTTRGKTKKRILALRCIAAGIAPVRRRYDGLRGWYCRSTEERHHPEN